MNKPATSSNAILQPDLCIIGAGPAGLSLAAAGALLGISVVLVAGDAFGEDEHALAAAALRASANRAHAMRNGFRFGIGHEGNEPEINFLRIQAHLREVVGRQASMTSLDRYRAMGVRLIQGGAHFTDPATVLAGNNTIKARRFVIAVGSRPFIPAIPGLETIAYLTGETILHLTERPRHLLVLGGGADGVSWAQTYRRLGARVTLIAPENSLLIDEDPEIVSIIDRSVRGEGMDLRLGSEIVAFEQGEGGDIVAHLGPDGAHAVEGSHLLVSAGRIPAIEGLSLKAGGLTVGPSGILVNRRMRTSNPRVYAIGGSSGHAAQAAIQQAGIAFRNAVLRLPTRFDPSTVVRVVYCEPELASVGMTEAQAREKGLTIRILRAPFADNDRATAERAAQGHIRAVVTPAGKILGCSVVGPHAQELIMPWALALAEGLSVTDLADLACPHPSYSEATKAAAVEFLKLSAQDPWLRRALGFIRRWG